MKGLPLPHLIAATATIYYKRHVEPAVQFIAQQQELFKRVDNDLSLLGMCHTCRSYYDPTFATRCAADGCHRHVGCGMPGCVFYESIEHCGLRWCMPCLLKCENDSLCPACYDECRECRSPMGSNQRVTCSGCNRDSCNYCTNKCVTILENHARISEARCDKCCDTCSVCRVRLYHFGDTHSDNCDAFVLPITCMDCIRKIKRRVV
jgi:hypothetical protein